MPVTVPVTVVGGNGWAHLRPSHTWDLGQVTPTPKRQGSKLREGPDSLGKVGCKQQEGGLVSAAVCFRVLQPNLPFCIKEKWGPVRERRICPRLRAGSGHTTLEDVPDQQCGLQNMKLVFLKGVSCLPLFSFSISSVS